MHRLEPSVTARVPPPQPCCAWPPVLRQSSATVRLLVRSPSLAFPPALASLRRLCFCFSLAEIMAFHTERPYVDEPVTEQDMRRVTTSWSSSPRPRRGQSSCASSSSSFRVPLSRPRRRHGDPPPLPPRPPLEFHSFVLDLTIRSLASQGRHDRLRLVPRIRLLGHGVGLGADAQAVGLHGPHLDRVARVPTLRHPLLALHDRGHPSLVHLLLHVRPPRLPPRPPLVVLLSSPPFTPPPLLLDSNRA